MSTVPDPRQTGPSRAPLRAVDDSHLSPDGLDTLLGRAAQGNAAAFEQLYDHIAGAVLGVATRVLRNRAIAEEIAQDVLVEVWRTSARYDPHRASAKTWILTIAHRRAVDRVRHEQSATNREQRVASRDHVRPYDDVSEQVESNLERQQIRHCLQGLTESQRESVTLAYYDGYTYPDVATLLHKPLGTIKTRIRDGIAKLRDCMTPKP